MKLRNKLKVVKQKAHTRKNNHHLYEIDMLLLCYSNRS